MELDQSPLSPTVDNSIEPYADEPLADEEWIANYRKEKEEKDQLENELNNAWKMLYVSNTGKLTFVISNLVWLCRHGSKSYKTSNHV